MEISQENRQQKTQQDFIYNILLISNINDVTKIEFFYACTELYIISFIWLREIIVIHPFFIKSQNIKQIFYAAYTIISLSYGFHSVKFRYKYL